MRRFAFPHLSLLLVAGALALSFRAARADDGQIDFISDRTATHLIEKPGSYRLTSDVTMTVDASCIQITANDVTLDLGGHTLTGTGNANNSPGIDAATVVGTVILNGRVKSFSGHGVACGVRSRISGVMAVSNRGAGIFCDSENLIENCHANANINATAEGGGIIAGFSSIIRNCIANDNGAQLANADCVGIQTGDLSSVTGCIANLNVGNGTGDGIGILIGVNSLVSGNSCTANHSGNDPAAAGIGIQAGSACTIIGNSCADNGPNATSGSGRGIVVSSGGLVKDNVCRNNDANGGTAYGIHVTGVDNRIESNNCAGHSFGLSNYGILVDGGRNVILRNSTPANSTSGIRLSAGGNRCQENLLGSTPLSDDGGNSIGTGDLANVTY